MRRQTFLFLTFAVTLTTALAASQAASFSSSAGAMLLPQSSGSAPKGVEVASLDRSTEACTDFFQYACGGWIAANPMPPDRQRWGRFNELQDQNFAVLRRIVESPNLQGDQKKAADYYAACMDERTIESRGVKPLASQLTRIAQLRRKDELMGVVARLHLIGVNVLFNFGSRTDLHDATKVVANIDQGGLGLPDRDYYLKTDQKSLDLKQKYQDHVAKMLGLLKDSDANPTGAPWSAAGASAVLAVETKLARAALDRTARRDPANTDHMTSTRDWRVMTPDLDWPVYLTTIGAPSFDRLNVGVPDYMKALDELVGSTSLDDLKTYLAWHLIHASAEMLPKAFADAHFDFFNRTLGGQEQPLPRWQRCVTQTDEALGEALGKAFVEAAFSPAAKADTLKMVQGIKAAMKEDIEAASWMSPQTKRAAVTKLNAVVDRIGYPDKWRDYSSVEIARDDALGNMQRATAFESARDLRKIGQPVDRSEWSMTPPTVNAYYSPDRNTINFPAGILQPPFYQEGRDAAVNYGGAGAVIGHELTHGFDDQGRKFNGSGNLQNWWTESDAKAYEARATCLADQYSEYVVAGDTHLNGRLTLGENTADNGGLRLALMAYLAGPGKTAAPMLEGFTPEQRFFVGFAQIWCESRRPEFERLRATTDPHSSGKYRVNGVVSNMPEFQKAFACKADAPMVRQNSCRVW